MIVFYSQSASGSLGREHSHSRRSDSESDRKRMRTDLAGSFKEVSHRMRKQDYNFSFPCYVVSK